MTVTVNEVSLFPDLTSSPSYTYQDKNISVYSIPVLDSAVQMAAPTTFEPSQSSSEHVTETGSTKRKREQSASLKDLMTMDDFSVERLEGELAQEWRKLMINTMFPASKNTKCKGNQPNKRRRISNNSEEPRIPEYSQNVHEFFFH
jgi:ribonuclease Z